MGVFKKAQTSNSWQLRSFRCHCIFKQEAAVHKHILKVRISLVGVSSDLIIHHHTVYQTLGQQARVLRSQLQSAQPAQVLALKWSTDHS